MRIENLVLQECVLRGFLRQHEMEERYGYTTSAYKHLCMSSLSSC